MDIKANCQEEHGQLCLPRGALSARGTARKAHNAQGQYNVFVPSTPHFAKAGIFAGSLRLALGACVSLPTTARRLPDAQVFGCSLTRSNR